MVLDMNVSDAPTLHLPTTYTNTKKIRDNMKRIRVQSSMSDESDRSNEKLQTEVILDTFIMMTTMWFITF